MRSGQQAETAMTYRLMESMVLQRLRDKKGQVYCADCLAQDFSKIPRRSGRPWTRWRPARTSRLDLARVARRDSCFAGRARTGSLERVLIRFGRLPGVSAATRLSQHSSALLDHLIRSLEQASALLDGVAGEDRTLLTGAQRLGWSRTL